MGCKGFQQSSCWLSPLPNKDLCATCDKKRLHEEAEVFLLHQTPPPTDEAILNFVLAPTTRELLIGPLLEVLLRKLYVSRRHLLPAVVDAIVVYTPLYLFLQTLFDTHAPCHLCDVFQYMIRYKLLPCTFKRLCCMKCIGNIILYHPSRADYVGVWFLTSSFLYSHAKQLVKSTLAGLHGRRLLKHLLSCVIESPHLTYKHVTLSGILSIVESVHPTFHAPLKDVLFEHPLYYSLLPSKGFTRTRMPIEPSVPHPPVSFLKKRVEPFREELMAKTWHPSRFVNWCLDLEEKEFLHPEEAAEPLAFAGHWNIPWH